MDLRPFKTGGLIYEDILVVLPVEQDVDDSRSVHPRSTFRSFELGCVWGPWWQRIGYIEILATPKN